MSKSPSPALPVQPLVPLPPGTTFVAHMKQDSRKRIFVCRHQDQTVVARLCGGHFMDSAMKHIAPEGDSLNHRNVLKFIGMFPAPGPFTWELCAYAPNGDLEQFIGNRDLTLARRYEICSDVGEGLAYLHAKHIVHFDVKPENLVIMQDNRVCICDFDSARPVNTDIRRFNGTLAYAAPEVRNGLKRHYMGLAAPPRMIPAMDIWSFGVTIWELFSNQSAYDFRRSSSQDARSVNAQFMDRRLLRPPEPALDNVDAQGIVSAATKSNPEDRLTATQLATSCMELRRALPTPRATGHRPQTAQDDAVG